LINVNISRAPIYNASSFQKKNTALPPAVISKNPVLPEDTQVIFIDGACTNNGCDDPMAGYATYWKQDHGLISCSPIPSSDPINALNCTPQSMHLNRLFPKNSVL
jgi:hypothetical protein